uniref:Uncharacterized protein n=1 Tax=Nelumbo nucifera TaxID=4432 RepID=A0A822YD40_NELNU|nr:TPA_asm: hypothetical protein HUJ06_031710 [Nelumbo nucifera]
MGNLPDSLLNSSNYLQELDVSHNYIYGPLPGWLGNLSRLISLAMTNNCLEGPVSHMNYGNWTNFNLLDNNIHGSVPNIFSPSSLQHVHLQNNGLKGPMSKAFSNCSSLVTLDVSYNHLTGAIPEWIGGLSNLGALLLEGNQFEGRIPKLQRLSIMGFSHNILSGQIRSCFDNITFARENEPYERNWEVFLSGIDLSCN